ncbi:MAG: ATP-binding protein [Anaeroplasma sp.]|nr:ATP-binding protein [Anaeroplasma sp.]
MDRYIDVDVTVGSGIIGTYQRMPQKLERVFSEFIDNTTQSFIDHKDELIKVTKSTVNKIEITWNNSEIVIKDKAFGMNKDDFSRALKLNAPADSYSENSRSQYGMGLKIAAAYLGDWYSIESTQLGSKEKYYAVVDVQEWMKTNPRTVKCTISDVQENTHYTIITIRKPLRDLTTSLDETLRKKLALIYSKDLDSGDLEIFLNGRPIISTDPELRENQETGSEYLNYFEDSFVFNEVEYNYSGWIGILKTASTDDAGFTLSQYGRGIKLNYRPSDIFGKPNSFQYQRVVGEIQLDDKKWRVTFNKDEFIWDDGLEKEFIKSLKGNKDIKYITSVAGTLRKDGPKKPIVEPKDIEKNTSKLQDKYSQLGKVEKTQVETYQPDSPTVVIEHTEEVKANIVNITWESVDYSFDIQVKNDDPDLPWFNVQKKSDDNAYYIVINGTAQYFEEYNKKECKDLIVNFAITLALAQLSSARLGVEFNKSGILINQMNQIIKNIK